MKCKGILTVVFLVLGGCATAGPGYYMTMTTVAGPTDSPTLTKNPTTGAFEDQRVAINATPGGGGIDLVVRNKSESAIQILWDEMTFVWGEQSQGVVNGETRFADVGLPQTPTQIASGTFVSTFAIPRSNIDTRYSVVRDFLPPGYKLTATVPARLTVPLRFGDQVRRYEVQFEARPPFVAP